MSWIWPEYINRELSLTRQERKAIHRDAWKLWLANKWNIVLYLALTAFYVLTVFLISDVSGWVATFIGASGLTHKLFRAGAPFALFVICFVVGGAVLQRSRFAPCIHRATRQHGHNVCPKCGYWLKGLGAEIQRCPECGCAWRLNETADSGVSGSSERP